MKMIVITTVWMMAVWMSGPEPRVTRVQRFDTIEHCQALIDKANAVGAKKQTINYFCAEGLMDQVGPAIAPDAAR